MTTWTHSPNEESSVWKVGYPIDTNYTAIGPISLKSSLGGSNPDSDGLVQKDAGSGYVVGDTFTISGGDGTATGRVTSVFLGTVNGDELTYGGDDYVRDITVGSSTTATSGSGTGLTFYIYWIDPYPIVTDWNTLKGGVWNLGSLVAWEDLDKHDWEDWN